MNTINLVTRRPSLISNSETQNYSLETQNAFKRLRTRAMWRDLWSRITGSSNRLDDLSRLQSQCQIDNRYALGVQDVPIERIHGSEGRTTDFDRQFNPRHNKSRDRWMRVFTAWQQDIPLPAVKLIKVGDEYFVRDGHHRISVAHLIGRQFIDAEVLVWAGWCRVA